MFIVLGDQGDSNGQYQDSLLAPSDLQHVLSSNRRCTVTEPLPGADDDDEKAAHDEALSEYRVRLISGLKRYFHSKHEQVWQSCWICKWPERFRSCSALTHIGSTLNPYRS